MLNIHEGTGAKCVGEYDGMNARTYVHTYVHMYVYTLFDAKMVIS